ncbi:MAG: leucine-rich repeat domain-containing protein, partial [Thermoguttaceae bacterium]
MPMRWAICQLLCLAVASANHSSTWAQGPSMREYRFRNVDLIDVKTEPKPIEAKAITEIHRLYGKVALAEMLPGRPVVSVDFSHIESLTDAGLVHLQGLTHLQSLDLRHTSITDAGLEHLKGLAQLRSLNLAGTQVTEEGVKRLQQALPECLILRQ